MPCSIEDHQNHQHNLCGWSIPPNPTHQQTILRCETICGYCLNRYSSNKGLEEHLTYRYDPVGASRCDTLVVWGLNTKRMPLDFDFHSFRIWSRSKAMTVSYDDPGYDKFFRHMVLVLRRQPYRMPRTYAYNQTADYFRDYHEHVMDERRKIWEKKVEGGVRDGEGPRIYSWPSELVHQALVLAEGRSEGDDFRQFREAAFFDRSVVQLSTHPLPIEAVPVSLPESPIDISSTSTPSTGTSSAEEFSPDHTANAIAEAAPVTTASFTEAITTPESIATDPGLIQPIHINPKPTFDVALPATVSTEGSNFSISQTTNDLAVAEIRVPKTQKRFRIEMEMDENDTSQPEFKRQAQSTKSHDTTAFRIRDTQYTDFGDSSFTKSRNIEGGNDVDSEGATTDIHRPAKSEALGIQIERRYVPPMMAFLELTKSLHGTERTEFMTVVNTLESEERSQFI
ncbi:hypothetical protein BJ508DRAFT_122779 [Ascobolus immersus RN42]|uniref:Uncharacterized protein n=1 Tax=Ascobolus immersus RN42 TaxID=1160509 RepID=A0A3N4I5T1_ASCIM|nr:hypothetical protein BJ508DRAFT_122779 [Ascobolus immersus RN42]